MTYCIVSLQELFDEPPGEVRFLSGHLPVYGSETVSDLSKAQQFDSLEEALGTLKSVLWYDQNYYPPVEPLIALVADNKLQHFVKSVLTQSGLDRFQEVSNRLGVSFA